MGILFMSQRSLKVENFEKYWGTADQVLKQMENCPRCGAKFVVTHLADKDHLYIHEELKCTNCNFGAEETLHILN